MKSVILSGMQPSAGGLTLGNYIGALRSWVELQNQYDCLFCVVDLHAITGKQEPAQLREACYSVLASYMAAGIDPELNTIFVQSQVPAHAELGWILNCHTYMGELSRMTQFKDKSAKGKTVGVGLLTYPVLMAADILLYQANLVPVGEDQKQHIELTRDLAIRLNGLHAKLFTVPEIFTPKVGARIMSLMDPLAKMSKTDPDVNATVFLSDDEAVITKKFKRAVTDSIGIVQDSNEQPGIRNLLSIQSALTGKELAEIVKSYEGKQYGALKTETAEIVVSHLKPFRERYQSLMADRAYLNQVFKQGAEKARARAESTLKRAKEAMGFIV